MRTKCNCARDDGYCHVHKRWANPIPLTKAEKAVVGAVRRLVKSWRTNSLED